MALRSYAERDARTLKWIKESFKSGDDHLWRHGQRLTGLPSQFQGHSLFSFFSAEDELADMDLSPAQIPATPKTPTFSVAEELAAIPREVRAEPAGRWKSREDSPEEPVGQKAAWAGYWPC